ncbi:sulfate permease [Streptomyces tirandamycinicus]|uniref:Sodium-independent anion transporter n=1 Tax=Streptomyces tirandamycinicus TaxID=2174846 RepID=A0A2S1SUI2_9ACTN|nr:MULTISPECIES: sulfate permease [Streptomyces]AWI30059.1 sodium-independent anion transporter [Streptomyces tirandamycinicus]MCY0981417.1 sulfate permease [Streptomyces tirandamycinicus]NNJ06454.1 sulfate permease [Streptomyces sp. PKU-MA01144]TFE47922.1 sulfate permease [Streptomyces sp. ICN441]
MADRTSGTGGRRHRALPALTVLGAYRRRWLRGDLLAGVTVAAYLVPQVMAYASVAGLPPVTGLWAILPGLALYALLGSSRLMSVGPESTTALMTATVVAPLAAGDPARYAVLASALAVTVALVCLVAWAARLGFVADLLSRPVLIGYLTGVALIMMVDQLTTLTGVPTEGPGFFRRLASFLSHLAEAHPGTVAFSAVALVLLFAALRLPGAFPGPLLVVALGTAAAAVFDLQARGVAVVGDVPAGLPGFALPDLGELPRLLLPAVGVLLVGYTDFILTARAFVTDEDEPRLDPNQELLALGAANLGAGLLRGFPVSSSASRTALARSVGAHTQLYGLVAGAAVVGVLLFLSPLLRSTPTAVLGALVVYAAVRMIDLAGYRRLASFRRRELLLALGCLVGVLVLDILYGVLLAVALSVAELLSRVARPHDAVQGLVPGMAGMHDVDDYAEARVVPGLLVYRYDSPLFFANAEDFRRRALAAVDEQENPVRWFVLNTEANVAVDITALDSVDAVRAELAARGIVFALARVKQDLRAELDAYGLTASVGEERIFPTLPTAVEAYRSWVRDQEGRPER